MSTSVGKGRGRKKQGARQVRRILILCEDSKSSRDYFAEFPHDPSVVQIECVGTGMNTVSLMKNAIRRADIAKKSGSPYERIWVVFDKDDFPLENFNRAIALARNHNEIEACWSNECFELWYLLHFHYRDTAIGRDEIGPSLSDLLGRKYDKSDTQMYKVLEDSLETALRNARRLAHENATAGCQTRNPSTRIHELVAALRRFNLDQQ